MGILIAGAGQHDAAADSATEGNGRSRGRRFAEWTALAEPPEDLDSESSGSSDEFADCGHCDLCGLWDLELSDL